jgi:hypothetical protein
VINRQLVHDADVVIGIFHATLGSATPRAASGTAEELGSSHSAGKPVHIYFSAMPIPRDHDRKALAELDAFKKRIGELGLYGSFDTPESLRDQVKRAIEHDLRTLSIDPARRPKSTGAALRASYSYDREPNNKGRLRNTRHRLNITNDGDLTAADVEVNITGNGAEDPPGFLHRVQPFTLPPKGSFSIPLMVYAGMGLSGDVEFKWNEDGEPHKSRQTVSFI